jgi:hypothetical protein
MNYRLKSLMLLAALPLCIAAMSQEAAAKDRFDVKIEVVDFYSGQDTIVSGLPVDYKYDLNVRIDGVANQTFKSRFKTRPKTKTRVGRSFHIRNVEAPERSNRRIKLSAKVEGEYRAFDALLQLYLSKNVGSTNRDLFDEADDARDDVAVNIVTLGNGRFVMNVRVTVTEVD